MKKLFLAIGVLALTHTANAQVGVGIATPDASSVLELSSTAKGFLPPRMTATERNAISSPAKGLLVFQTDGTAGLYYNAGTPAAKDWRTVGNSTYAGVTVYTPGSGTTQNITIPLTAAGSVALFDFNNGALSVTLNITMPSPSAAGAGARVRFSYSRLNALPNTTFITPSGLIFPATGNSGSSVSGYVSSEFVSDGSNWREIAGI